MQEGSENINWLSKVLGVCLSRDIADEVEGDLLENYHWRLKRFGRIKAKLYLWYDLLFLVRLFPRYGRLKIRWLRPGRKLMPYAISLTFLFLILIMKDTIRRDHLFVSGQPFEGVALLTNNPVVPVKNIEESAGFYENRMGFTNVYSASEYEGGPANYAVMCKGNVCVLLQRSSDADLVSTPRIRLRVDNVESLLEEFRIKGAVSEKKSVSYPVWGTKEFDLYDPNMVNLTFYEEFGETIANSFGTPK